jgi:hypothetical protein
VWRWSRPAWREEKHLQLFEETRENQILRFALHHTVQGFAQTDTLWLFHLFW